MTVEFRRYGNSDAGSVTETLLDMHSVIHSDSDDPFRKRERFAGFVAHWSKIEGWSCVIGYDAGDPVGFAYGAPFRAGKWWSGGRLPDGMEGASFALSELMVLPRWRKTGISSQLHEALVGTRSELRATLLVDAAHPKVQALYEGWGYEKVDEQKPFNDSPVFAVMVKRLGPQP